MRNAAVRYGGIEEQIIAQMTRAQAMRLRTLAEEAYQPKLFERDLSQAEADRRIEVLRAEIDLANSF
jgi:hypothetical protein